MKKALRGSSSAVHACLLREFGWMLLAGTVNRVGYFMHAQGSLAAHEILTGIEIVMLLWLALPRHMMDWIPFKIRSKCRRADQPCLSHCSKPIWDSNPTKNAQICGRRHYVSKHVPRSSVCLIYLTSCESGHAMLRICLSNNAEG